MRIIIDNDYSRHNFTRVTKKKRKGKEEREAYIYSLVCSYFWSWIHCEIYIDS